MKKLNLYKVSPSAWQGRHFWIATTDAVDALKQAIRIMKARKIVEDTENRHTLTVEGCGTVDHVSGAVKTPYTELP